LTLNLGGLVKHRPGIDVPVVELLVQVQEESIVGHVGQNVFWLGPRRCLHPSQNQFLCNEKYVKYDNLPIPERFKLRDIIMTRHNNTFLKQNF